MNCNTSPPQGVAEVAAVAAVAAWAAAAAASAAAAQTPLRIFAQAYSALACLLRPLVIVLLLLLLCLLECALFCLFVVGHRSVCLLAPSVFAPLPVQGCKQ